MNHTIPEQIEPIVFQSGFEPFSSIFLPIFGAIVAGIVVNLVVQKLKNIKTISDTKKALIAEIKANVSSLKDEPKLMTEDKIKLLFTPAYDSIVQTGNFLLLNEDLRKKLSDLNGYIQVANYTVEQLIKTQFTPPTAGVQDKFVEIRKKQFSKLTDYHNTITKGSAEILTLLEKKSRWF